MRKLIRSFRFAVAGFTDFVRSQRNTRLHLLAAVIVVTVGIVLKIDRLDWACLIFAITSVFVAEAFNTTLELLADRITSEQDILIGRAKDVAAAAVLIASIGAAAIGIIVLGPHLFAALRHN